MVRLLFSMKGVSLEADPEPYMADLEEFFPGSTEMSARMRALIRATESVGLFP